MPLVPKQDRHSFKEKHLLSHPPALHQPIIRYMMECCKGRFTSKGQGKKYFEDESDVLLIMLAFDDGTLRTVKIT